MKTTSRVLICAWVLWSQMDTLPNTKGLLVGKSEWGVVDYYDTKAECERVAKVLWGAGPTPGTQRVINITHRCLPDTVKP